MLSSISKLSKQNQNNRSGQKLTIFSEYEAIEIAIQIIDLLSVLHSKNIVHTNLNPGKIFLIGGNPERMCFLNLYHCSWQTQDLMNNSHISMDFEDNISLFDTRTRNKMFISPEQVQIGNELGEIVYQRNGKIDESQHEIQDFLHQNFN